MTAFDTNFAASAALALLGDPNDPDDLGQFGEWITYRPREGRPRRIRAMVTRKPPDFVSEDQRLINQKVAIRVYDDPENGISGRTVDRGGDRVEVALLKGQPAVSLSITLAPMHSNGGLLRLECG